ncbi:MAG: FG-GAP repeat protein [Phycisphaerae bacterium]|nr:FG-GAP repeat protein [Phycisphaerae bacterium]
MMVAKRFGTPACCALALVITGMLVAWSPSCTTAPTPFIIQGPGQTGNQPPELTFVEPVENITADQGRNFLIRWTDSDPDNNAQISFSLVNTVTNQAIVLVTNISENDTIGPDQFTVGTTLVPIGAYNLLGTIDDDVNPPVNVYAQTTSGGVTQRVVVRVVAPGQGQQTVPPVVTITEPSFNQSVAQDDTLRIALQPTPLPPADTRPYDPDSTITLYLMLDLDQNPNNDDPANPDPSQIILLRTPQQINEDAFEQLTFDITVDLTTIPPRPGGLPYYIRATLDDLVNPRVHSYAVGQINVVELAAGGFVQNQVQPVDLFDIGRTVAGVKVYGFNPGASLGSTMSTISDFDADGVDDFVLVAQFGNPRNFGPIGEAYGIYGQDGVRFGGTINVNSVSQVIPGVIFEAPPVRNSSRLGASCARSDAFTNGIVDVNFLPDMSGDGRPEIIFGLSHVHCAIDAMDYDPDDTDIAAGDQNVPVVLTLREGQAEYTVGEDTPVTNFNYRGTLDTTISSAAPNTAFGQSSELSWQDVTGGERQWTLLKFTDVLAELPDSASNIDTNSIQASLQVRVFRQGPTGNVHQLVTDFSETTTYADFSNAGGDPVGGEQGDPTADYIQGTAGSGGLGSIDATQPDIVEVDVSDLVQLLIDGLLDQYDNELRFIIVPAADESTLASSVRSGEFSITDDRPLLTINYNRRTGLGGDDCYPDNLVNNRSDSDENDVAPDHPDVEAFAGGMAVIFNSSNRDNNPIAAVPATRLEQTSVALELVGAESGIRVSDTSIYPEAGLIFARCDNSNADVLGNDSSQENRIAGARVVAGGFDYIDARLLNQGPRNDLFGSTVASMGDVNNDGLSEIIISAPGNEMYQQTVRADFGNTATQLVSTQFRGSIAVLPGANYNDNFWREIPSNDGGNSELPILDQQHIEPFGSCTDPREPRSYFSPTDTFEVFAESPNDYLGGASSAGDFNQDGIDDILCGAPGNDRSQSLPDSGAVYVIYGRTVIGDFDLKNADDPIFRPPMLRIRGEKAGDGIGWRQVSALDVNGDRINDVVFSSPFADYGGIRRTACEGRCSRCQEFNGQRCGLNDPDPEPGASLSQSGFNTCRSTVGDEVFCDDACKIFDYDNDGDIDEDDQTVFQCVVGGGSDCCANMVDNGFIGIVFGGVYIDGDRRLSQLATTDLPGVIFYGAAAGHLAGYDISSAGDFNQDSFGDILISAPGVVTGDNLDPNASRARTGVAYLIFGGPHLENKVWNLSQVGTPELPGIVFISPYLKGRPNEAAPRSVRALGDINNDGFGDIGIGNPQADFIDLNFPQGPDATDADTGRRRNAGDVYIIYGNNFGPNRELPR